MSLPKQHTQKSCYSMVPVCVNCMLLDAQCNMLKAENELLWDNINTLTDLVETSMQANTYLKQRIVNYSLNTSSTANSTTGTIDTPNPMIGGDTTGAVIEDGIMYNHVHQSTLLTDQNVTDTDVS